MLSNVKKRERDLSNVFLGVFFFERIMCLIDRFWSEFIILVLCNLKKYRFKVRNLESYFCGNGVLI